MRSNRMKLLLALCFTALMSPLYTQALLIDTTYYVDIKSSISELRTYRSVPVPRRVSPDEGINVQEFGNNGLAGAVDDESYSYVGLFANFNPFIGEVGNSVFDISTEFRQISTVTNDSDVDQFLNIDLLIKQGVIETGRIHLEMNDYLVSGFSSSLLVDGQSLWNTQAVIFSTKDISEFIQQGVLLDGHENLFLSDDYPSDASLHSYSWDDYETSFSLIKLGAGQTISLEYALTAFVAGQLDHCTYNCYRYSHSMIDTVNFFQPLNEKTLYLSDIYVAPPTLPVPESMMIILLLSGLAAIAHRRRYS